MNKPARITFAPSILLLSSFTLWPVAGQQQADTPTAIKADNNRFQAAQSQQHMDNSQITPNTQPIEQEIEQEKVQENVQVIEQEIEQVIEQEKQQEKNPIGNQPTTPTATATDRFIPTESISEDLAVSFPVDI